MLRQAIYLTCFVVMGCASASYSQERIKVLNPMLESYVNSPLQGGRLRCDFGTLVEQGGKAKDIIVSAGDLIRCMPAPLVAAIRAAKIQNTYHSATDMMNDLATQICSESSPLFKYYETNLPYFTSVAVSDGWKKDDYLNEMKRDYPLFCSQLYESLLSDIATRYGLSSVITGNSSLGKALEQKGRHGYREMSQVVLTCSARLLKGQGPSSCDQ